MPTPFTNLNSLPPYLTQKDLCNILRISPTAIQNAVKASSFPNPIRISKRTLRWSKEDIINFLRSSNKSL